MKNTLWLFLALAILSTAALWDARAEDTPAPATQTLTGEYLWDQRDMGGALEAVFTPTGEDTWEVSFHFTFREEAHTYTGTAEGSLSQGALKGTVLNEDKKRTFTFTGAFENGVFNGTHAEIREDGVRDTGTLTLQG